MPDREEYYNAEIPSSSNAHWVPWLQKQLMTHDIKADTPEVPESYQPQWDLWRKEVERFEITPETILVGHSCGGGFWLRYLSENPHIKVARIILVAPWLNVNHEEDITFFNFEFDSNIVTHAKDLIIFASDNDNKDVQDSISFLRKKLSKSHFRDFHNYGHFCFEDMKTTEFPELLEECLK